MNDGEPLLPLFLKLAGRKVLLVGGGPVAAEKSRRLVEMGARLTVVAPAVVPELRRAGTTVVERRFEPEDLDGAWLVVAAAPPEVNRRVGELAEARRLFVLAVDDPAHGTAYAAANVRRGGVTIAVSTEGQAPALAGLVREGLEALLPGDLDGWTRIAQRARVGWRRDRTPMPSRRPQLLRELNRMYQRKATGAEDRAMAAGSVALVGAGPGDPALLTLRGAELLSTADLVLHDALVAPEMRALAPSAHWFYVGKRAGRHSIAQIRLNDLMVRHARRGRRIVRLKCGDPFVLGRGGEEVLALSAAGVPVEVVPGVSSAIAGPELAGIPVTHRGLSSGFAVVSGHDADTCRQMLSALRPRSMTVVVLMGLGRRAEIARQLAAHGWPPATPAAIVIAASTQRSFTWSGDLASLGEASLPEQVAGEPGLLVVGDVVGIASGAVAKKLVSPGSSAASK